MNQLELVNKEQAIKLKESGFDWECVYHYLEDHELPAHNQIYIEYTLFNKAENWNSFSDKFSAPELDLACKWLREVKGIIVVSLVLDCRKNLYTFDLFTKTGKIYIKRESFNSYEAAQSAGLDIILKELSNKKITDLERSKGRSEDYYQLSAEEQWEQDKHLGLLDWDGK